IRVVVNHASDAQPRAELDIAVHANWLIESVVNAIRRKPSWVDLLNHIAAGVVLATAANDGWALGIHRPGVQITHLRAALIILRRVSAPVAVCIRCADDGGALSMSIVLV